MRLNVPLFLSVVVGLQTFLQLPFTDWLIQQKKLCFANIIHNIGNENNDIPNGVVVASPSKSAPDYYYQWTRDSAITIQTLIYSIQEQFDPEIKDLIEAYIWNTFKLQRLNTKSGTFKHLDGLGEPKFYINSTAFNEHWGRPQRDGPGLRSITIINYLNFLNETDRKLGNDLNSTFVYDEIVRPDLNYITKFHNVSGFDLWEEVDSKHFFTSMMHLKSLQLGIDANYDAEFTKELTLVFEEVKQSILYGGNFISNLPYIVETPENKQRTGLDIASILAILYTDFDIPNLRIQDSLVMNTLGVLNSQFKSLYPINKLHEFELGKALGRYPEDIYDGVGTSEGNPWFLSTSAAGEFIYRLVYKLLTKKQNIIIDQSNQEFFKNIVQLQEKPKVLTYGTDEYDKVIARLVMFGDSYLQIVKFHSDHGKMSEQLNKYTGFLQGARDLTWSYSSVWNAIDWRQKVSQLL